MEIFPWKREITLQEKIPICDRHNTLWIDWNRKETTFFKKLKHNFWVLIVDLPGTDLIIWLYCD